MLYSYFLIFKFSIMKMLKKLDDFQDLSKDNLINDLLQKTLKGGCCAGTMGREAGPKIQ